MLVDTQTKRHNKPPFLKQTSRSYDGTENAQHSVWTDYQIIILGKEVHLKPIYIYIYIYIYILYIHTHTQTHTHTHTHTHTSTYVV